MNKFFPGALLGIVLAGVLLAAYSQRDDSDPPGGRSGMHIYTDHLTGCQYLRPGSYSGITPRLAADGKQICKGPTP